MKEETKEQLPAEVLDKMLGGKPVRVAMAKHPVTGEMAPCVPVVDFANAFSQTREGICRMISRTKWLKKYTLDVIMTDHLGRLRPHQCVFEECGLGITIKLQPSRNKNAEAAEALESKQEEYILILADALRGYRIGHGGFDYANMNGMLPRPGLSFDAICGLVRLVDDRHIRTKTALRALNFYGKLPVEDLEKAVDARSPGDSELAGLIAQYLQILMDSSVIEWGIEKGVTEEGAPFIEGKTSEFFNAFMTISRKEKLPKFFKSSVQLGQILGKEAEAIEFIGWRRSEVGKRQGFQHFRFERMTTIAGKRET